MIYNPQNPVNQVYDDLSFEAYVMSVGLNNSRLKAADRSLWRFKQILDNPDRNQFDTESLLQGRQFHTLLLEPDLFHSRYAILDAAKKAELVEAEKERVEAENLTRVKSKWLTMPTEFSRRFSAYKEWEIDCAGKGMELVDAQWFVGMSEMCNAIRDYEEVWESIEGSQTEVTVFGCFAGGGGDTGNWLMQLKARLDMLKQSGDSVIDLKTTVNASSEPFAAHIQKYGYHKQLAFYVDVCRLAGLDKSRAGILAVEKEWPYECALHWIPDEWLELGRREYRADLYKIAHSFQMNDWPRIGVAEIMPPPWVDKLLSQI